MSKKDINDLKKVLAVVIFILLVMITYKINFPWNTIYTLIGLLLFSVLISEIVTVFIPVKSKKGTVKNRTKTNSSTRVRPEKELYKTPIKNMNWREFEEICYLYFKDKGWKPRKTKEGADGGIDLIVFNKELGAEEAVQIKHWKGQVPVKEIRDLNSAKRNYKCVLARFITSSTFSSEALNEADKYRIETHDREWVEGTLEKWKQKKARNM